MMQMNFMKLLLDEVEIEWKTLGEMGGFKRGKRFVKTDMLMEGFPCIHYGEIYTHYDVWAEEAKSFVSYDLASKLRCAETGDVVIVAAGETIEDIGKGTAWLGKTGVVIHDACFAYRSSINPKYVSYFLRTKQFHDQIKKYISSGKISSINAKGLSKVRIPIPPTDIQEKIVDILDIFSELTAELIAELTAELTARKKQYNYYRDKLLTFNEGEFEWKALSELAENLDSMRKPITSSLREYGDIPYYGASGIIDYVKDYIFEGDFLLVSEDGANLLGRNTPIAFSVSGKVWVNNHAHVLKFKTYEDRRFVEFYLNHIDLTTYISGAAQPKLNQRNLNSIMVPNPSASKKKRIVLLLDKFDALTSSINEVLPREIELRRMQYEYYRELLFSFPKSEVEA